MTANELDNLGYRVLVAEKNQKKIGSKFFAILKKIGCSYYYTAQSNDCQNWSEPIKTIFENKKNR